jgi:sigma-B regulation protein RsbU (phosphoserine phosphatase)
MALSMSAATIYASEFGMPAKVLRHMDDALRDELESTEMYLTLFYGVIDPSRRRLVYSNAGHPHAFVVHADGSHTRLGATDPPVGIAGLGAYGQEEVPWSGSGDLLALFTDGLADTLTSQETGKGEALVLNEVVLHKGESADEIVHALFALSRPAGVPAIPPDDRTAIVVRA